MRKSKLLIGMTIGIIGCRYFNSFKGIVKPEMVKVIKGAIIAGENTKLFLKDAAETALTLNKKRYKKISEGCTQEDETNIADNINNLNKKLIEIQQQLSLL